MHAYTSALDQQHRQQLDVLQQLPVTQVYNDNRMDRPVAMNRSGLQNFDNFDKNFGIVNDNSQNASDLSGEIITDSDKYPSRIPGRNQIA